ncbi:hypothetical protein HS121_17600 [bacterium]|nr:hypothetical protein [bacterium]
MKGSNLPVKKQVGGLDQLPLATTRLQDRKCRKQHKPARPAPMGRV